MTAPAIRIDNLSKRYKLGLTHAGSVRELANRVASRLTGRRGGAVEHAEPDRVDETGCFWALKDVSFEVQPGEVVGIIGKNGAGKSTLLKILSRITKPTSGEVRLRGRVASLLEVGTGFHPELTGRENVYLNGTILGMTKREVDRQFDAIVDFAGVEKFIDTPVKRYSSGMTVRLGFAVAAHLEPEILIVDEVLAVGDFEFQRKCIEKMESVGQSGRTVIFVSHSLPSIKSLTTRGIVFEAGKTTFDGATDAAVDFYIEDAEATLPRSVNASGLHRPFSGLTRHIEFVELSVPPASVADFENGTPIDVVLRAVKECGPVDLGVTVFSDDGAAIGSTFSDSLGVLAVGPEHRFRCSLPTASLAPGHYHCAISVTDLRTRVMHDSLREVLPFLIEPEEGSSRTWKSQWGRTRLGVLPHHRLGENGKWRLDENGKLPPIRTRT